MFGADAIPTGNYSGSAEFYNPATNQWTGIPNVPTPRGFLAAAVGLDGTIYVIGGYNNTTGILNKVEAYYPPTNTWTTLASLPVPTDHLAAAAGPNGHIFAIGGTTGSGNVSNVYDYNPGTNTWVAAPSMSTVRFDLAAARGLDGRIYAIGGYDGVNNVSASTVEAYNTTSGTWSPVAGLLNPHANGGAATGADGRLYVVGGDLSNEVEAYDTTLNAWAGKFATVPNNTGAMPVAATGEGRIVAVTNQSNTGGTYAYGPNLTVSPTTGSAGQTVNVTGSNFGANASFSIYWGTATGLPAHTGTTDGAGNFASVPLVVPSGGADYLTVIDNRAFYPVTRVVLP